MEILLQARFQYLSTKFSNDLNLISSLWLEILEQHSTTRRYYHNLTHLRNLYRELYGVKHTCDDWDTILLALFYHDIVYDVNSKKNEDNSAEIAKARLGDLNIPIQKIERCYRHIIATKSHQASDDNDTNLFTDADLSILGKSPELYDEYCTNVRKEYSIYPTIIYNSGRKKVIRNILEMNRIFKSDHFFNLYEEQARTNLARELDKL